MSMFTCELCDKLLDGDYVECYERGDGLICIDCHSDLPLKGLRFDELYEFYKGFKGEDVARAEANKHIAFQNKFYEQDESHE